MTCSIFCICQILKRYIFYHFTENCRSYPAHDVYNFHDVCKDRVVYPYFMPILILSVVFGSLRHLLVIISPYSMSTVIYFHYPPRSKAANPPPRLGLLGQKPRMSRPGGGTPSDFGTKNGPNFDLGCSCGSWPVLVASWERLGGVLGPS